MQEGFHYHEIVPHLFLSGLQTARSVSALNKLDIAAILTVGEGLDLEIPRPFNFIAHKVINVRDSPSENLGQYFGSCTRFITRWLERGKNVLVHCRGGISRSPSVIAAWVMRELGVSPKDALDFVQHKRPITNPNGGFRIQLQAYEDLLDVEWQRQQKRLRIRMFYAAQMESLRCARTPQIQQIKLDLDVAAILMEKGRHESALEVLNAISP